MGKKRKKGSANVKLFDKNETTKLFCWLEKQLAQEKSMLVAKVTVSL